VICWLGDGDVPRHSEAFEEARNLNQPNWPHEPHANPYQPARANLGRPVPVTVEEPFRIGDYRTWAFVAGMASGVLWWLVMQVFALGQGWSTGQLIGGLVIQGLMGFYIGLIWIRGRWYALPGSWLGQVLYLQLLFVAPPPGGPMLIVPIFLVLPFLIPMAVGLLIGGLVNDFGRPDAEVD
jgi:hypothetical protein